MYHARNSGGRQATGPGEFPHCERYFHLQLPRPEALGLVQSSRRLPRRHVRRERVKRRMIGQKSGSAFLVGANYWASKSAHRMWELWDPDEIEKDIVLARSIGLNCLRTFFWTPQLSPLPGVVDEAVIERFGQFVKICANHDIGVFPTIFVGHMSGTNWDIPWRQGRDFCADPYMIYWESDLVRRVVGRFRGNRSILGWILTNELPNYTGPMSAETAATWTRAMHQAVKEADPDALVSTGDGARCEVRPDYDGFRVEWVHDHVDWLGVHLYNYFHFEKGDGDEIRKSYHIPCRIRYVDVGETPVLLEEFGLSSLASVGPEAAGYYRSVLYSSLLNGCCGSLGWCLTDFDLPNEVPYSFQPHELQFGVADAQRKLKPQGEVLQSFASAAQKWGFERYQMAAVREAIFVSYTMYRDYPSHGSIDRLRAYRALEECFTLAKMAGLNPDFVRSIDALDTYSLLFIPAGARLLSPEWVALQRWVEKGGTVYYSFTGFVGSVYAQNFRELFGCEQRVRFGQLEQPEEAVVRLTVRTPFGALTSGTEIALPRGPLGRESAYLAVEPVGARVIAADDHGRPALLSHSIGKGRAILSTYPLEYMLLNTPDANLDTRAHDIYRAIAEEIGIGLRFEGKHPWIEAGILEEEGGNGKLLVCVNHSHSAVSATMTDRTTGQKIAVELGMKGVMLFTETGGRWESLP